MNHDIARTNPVSPGLEIGGFETGAVVMVAELTEIVDFAALREYWQQVQPLLKGHGAVVLAQLVGRDGRIEGPPVKGNSVHTVQLWPSREAFDEFWASPDYERIRAVRQGACTSTITLLPVVA